jgi:hypothetical protein
VAWPAFGIREGGEAGAGSAGQTSSAEIRLQLGTQAGLPTTELRNYSFQGSRESPGWRLVVTSYHHTLAGGA